MRQLARDYTKLVQLSPVLIQYLGKAYYNRHAGNAFRRDGRQCTVSRSEHKLRLEGAPLKLIWISETALRSTYKRAAAHSSRASGVAFVQSTTVGEDASRGCTQHSPMTINRPLQQATRDLDIVLSRLFVVPRGRRKFHLSPYSEGEGNSISRITRLGEDFCPDQALATKSFSDLSSVKISLYTKIRSVTSEVVTPISV